MQSPAVLTKNGGASVAAGLRPEGRAFDPETLDVVVGALERVRVANGYSAKADRDTDPGTERERGTSSARSAAHGASASTES
jgi:hypothetical protein